MKKYLGLVFLGLLTIAAPAFAQGGDSNYLAPIGAGLLLGIAALGGTLGQGKAVAAALDSIGRNPSASGTIMIQMILGLALIESLVIISFVGLLFILGVIGG